MRMYYLFATGEQRTGSVMRCCHGRAISEGVALCMCVVRASGLSGEWRDGCTCRTAPCVTVTGERSPKELPCVCAWYGRVARRGRTCIAPCVAVCHGRGDLRRSFCPEHVISCVCAACKWDLRFTKRTFTSAGWDAVTGVGTPNYMKLAEAVANLPA